MRHLAILLAIGLATSVVACKKEPSNDGHAAANAKPGSHEDWCGEHGVAESQCTLCNKTLIPAFKATGDWCDEHKLPKSHDKTCSPNLKIVRPPKS